MGKILSKREKRFYLFTVKRVWMNCFVLKTYLAKYLIHVLALGLIIFLYIKVHVDKAFKQNDIQVPTYEAKINDNLYSSGAPFVYKRLFSEP